MGFLKKATRWLFLRDNSKKIVMNQARREGNVIHGSSAMHAQMGGWARPPKDVDVWVKQPKKSAKTSEELLDAHYGSDQFYRKPALHPGTTKVMNKGWDGRKGTDDDFVVADVSPFPKSIPPTVTLNGNKFVKLGHIVRTKKETLKKPEMIGRHEKDLEDVQRIKFWRSRI